MDATAFHSACFCGTHAPRTGMKYRLHILRHAPRADRSYRTRAAPPEVGWCGTGAWGHRHEITPLPVAPPAGLAWCGACVGRYADHIGRLPDLVAVLVGADPASAGGDVP